MDRTTTLEVSWRIMQKLDELHTHIPENDEQSRELTDSVDMMKRLFGKYTQNQRSFTQSAFFQMLQSIDKLLESTLVHSKKLLSPVVATHAEAFKWLYRNDFLLCQRTQELNAIFPPDALSPTVGVIQDRSALSFWATNFGANTIQVPNGIVVRALQTKFNTSIIDTPKERIFVYFLDPTRDGFVSQFDFNLFTRWFGPIDEQCPDRIYNAVNRKILTGYVPATEAQYILERGGLREGKYLIRFSKSQPDSFGLTYVDARGSIKHARICTRVPVGGLSGSPDSTPYPNLLAFVEAFPQLLREPCGNFFEWLEETAISYGQLSVPLAPFGGSNGGSGPSSSSSSSASSPASAEQSPVLPLPQPAQPSCTICEDAPVNAVFLECGHLGCCVNCAKKCKICPFCRAPIARIKTIHMM
eukprot:TRINITY_DN928_c4_g1_i1.p1 TRINITY_DN928_c4_g1~~TRINITY_DN928_c4_g1_i1.p1  ORF type:complete len:421 (-),score=118.73 TRINITY_DN928_c4_g1_i1:162-1403(-)